jgi:opacity protein-like surface antigen
VHLLPFGTASLFYTRGVGVAGGFGGPTDTETVSGTLVMPTWRDLLIILNAGWTKAKSLSDEQIQNIDVSVVTVGLGVAYRVNPYVTVFGGYSFLRQRVGQSSTTQDFDADQNRVKVGIQFGYPIAFDL